MIESTINQSVVSNDNLVPRVLSVPTISNLKIEIKQKKNKKTPSGKTLIHAIKFPCTCLSVINFAELLSYFCLLQGTEGDRNMKHCLKAVEKYVLKPQREGGGE